jgi:putative hydrolase of the HAD superfamily
VPVTAVVFDLDDTLVDTHGAWQQTWTAALEIVLDHVPHADADEVTRRYLAAETRVFREAADGKIDLVTYRQRCIVEALAPWTEPGDELLAAYLAERERISERIALFPDAVPTLRRLREQGVRIGVLTNGPTELQRPKLERLGINHEVDAVAISGEIGVAKPAPEAFRIVLDRLEADASRAAMVGDSLENDVHGALDAGLDTAVWIAGRADEAPAGVLVAASLTAVPSLLALA